MKFEITWSPESLDDLEKIANYISKDSPGNALNFIDEIIASTTRLESYPESGTIYEENPMLRFLVVKKYKVIYLFTSGDVQIVTVLGPYQHFNTGNRDD